MSVLSYNVLQDFLASATFQERMSTEYYQAPAASDCVGGVAENSFCAIGGQDPTGIYNRIIVYNLITKATQVRGSSASNTTQAAGDAYQDRYIVYFGGQTLGAPDGVRTTKQYDVRTDTFTTLSSGPDRRLSAAGATTKAALFVIGGYSWDQSDDVPIFARFIVSNNSWSTMEALPIPARAVALAGDKNEGSSLVYVLYKTGSYNVFASGVSRYWTNLPSCPWEVTGGKGEIVEGKIYFFTEPSSRILVYDIASKTWSQGLNINGDYRSAITGVFRGTAIVAQGNYVANNMLEIYDKYSSNVSTTKMNEVQSSLALLNRRELKI